MSAVLLDFLQYMPEKRFWHAYFEQNDIQKFFSHFFPFFLCASFRKVFHVSNALDPVKKYEKLMILRSFEFGQKNFFVSKNGVRAKMRTFEVAWAWKLAFLGQLQSDVKNLLFILSS